MKLGLEAPIRFLLLSVIAAVMFSSCQSTAQKESTEQDEAELEDEPEEEVTLEYGLPADSFHLVKKTIQRNETLSTILSSFGISSSEISTLVEKAEGVFNIKNLRAGSDYTIFCDKHHSERAVYLGYQVNPIDYVVFDLSDNPRVYTDQLPTTTEEKTVSGLISSSLSEALTRAGGSQQLIAKLAEIYAWDIDFYAIQKGDWFKVVYDQKYVNGEPIEVGEVKSAVFNHAEKDFYAFHFKDEEADIDGYYDENGKSIKKAFLKAPLKYYRISSRYTLRRFHPVQHRMKAHLGTDYAAPAGTPIMSTANGVVIASQYTKFNGNYVKIRHNGTYTTQYLHMSRRAVSVGQRVQQGQTIGYVGSTGLATGPHVCYRFWKNGQQVDALKQHFPPAEPIEGNQKASFDQLVSLEKSKLNNIRVSSGLLAEAR